jgi:hypothetical protein
MPCGNDVDVKEFCCEYVYDVADENHNKNEKEKKRMMNKEEARGAREKLEGVQKKKEMVIWHAGIWIMLLEWHLRTFGSLTVAELKKLDENRRRKAFMERGHAWGCGRIAALREFEAGCCDV